MNSSVSEQMRSQLMPLCFKFLHHCCPSRSHRLRVHVLYLTPRSLGNNGVGSKVTQAFISPGEYSLDSVSLSLWEQQSLEAEATQNGTLSNAEAGSRQSEDDELVRASQSTSEKTT